MKQAILISTGLLLTTPFIHAEKNKDKKTECRFYPSQTIWVMAI